MNRKHRGPQSVEKRVINPPFSQNILLTRGGFLPHLDCFMTQKPKFWARLRRNYCNNQLNYTDYCLVTYIFRTPICHPITITHDNYSNYSNYCLKTYWFSTHSWCFLRLRMLLLQLYWLLQNNVSVIAPQARPKIGFLLLRIIITPITLIILVIVSISSFVTYFVWIQDLLTRGVLNRGG